MATRKRTVAESTDPAVLELRELEAEARRMRDAANGEFRRDWAKRVEVVVPPPVPPSKLHRHVADCELAPESVKAEGGVWIKVIRCRHNRLIIREVS